MSCRLFLAALTATALAGPAAFAQTDAGQASGTQSADQVKLTQATSERYGAYVADAESRALYLLEADERGPGQEKAESNCYDKCAAMWPPLLAKGDVEVGPDLRQDLVGTIQREDGSTQVTYGGWPLYYYVKDAGPAQVTGQDVHDAWGEWYLVSPDGTQNEKGD